MVSKKDAIARREALGHMDTLESVLAGFGQGKASQTYFVDPAPLTQGELTAMYEGNWLAKKIVTKVVNDAMRPGIEINGFGDALSDYLRKRWYELGVPRKIKRAKHWARLYGGGALVIVAEERKATDLWRPLIPANIKRILDLRVADAFELTPNTFYSDPLKEKFGQPRTYSYTPMTPGVSASAVTIHESRIIKFDGEARPSASRTGYVLNMWGASCLQAIYDEIQGNAIFEDCTIELSSDFVTRVLTMNNLAALVANKQDDLIRRRVELVSKQLTPHRTCVIDKDEMLEKKQASIAGYDSLITYFKDIVSGASGYPAAVLFSQQMGTLAGATETKNDYTDFCLDTQEDMTEQVDRFFELILLEEGAPKNMTTDDYEWEWKSVTPKNNKTEADARNVQADVDKKYIELGVLGPDEVRANRFGSGEYSFQTQVEGDMPLEDPALLEAEGALEAEKQKNAATPPVTQPVEKPVKTPKKG